MGATLWKNAVRDVVDKMLETNPEWYGVLAEYQHRLKKRFYPQWEVDMFFDHWGNHFDIYDAYCFARLHADMGEGRIAVCRANVGETPFPDRNRARNNQVLQCLPIPFRGEFYGAHDYECDGFLAWDKPIVVTVPSVTPFQTIIAPQQATLEVGYQDIHKTLGTLVEDSQYGASGNGYLARWPYGYESVFLIVRNNHGFKKATKAKIESCVEHLYQMPLFDEVA